VSAEAPDYAGVVKSFRGLLQRRAYANAERWRGSLQSPDRSLESYWSTKCHDANSLLAYFDSLVRNAEAGNDLAAVDPKADLAIQIEAQSAGLRKLTAPLLELLADLRNWTRKDCACPYCAAVEKYDASVSASR
jgi:hypothetical protein